MEISKNIEKCKKCVEREKGKTKKAFRFLIPRINEHWLFYK